MVRLGINGYGRIGRNIHRLTLEHPGVEVVAINSRSSTEMRVHLLKYDSLHGTLPHAIKREENLFFVNGEQVQNFSIKNAEEIPWSDCNVDIVLESSGKARKKELAEKHLGGSVRNVLVTAPMKDDTPTFVFGVNEENISSRISVLSNASCTTNSIAPTLKLLSQEYGIENAFVTSIHSFTNSQNLLDNSGRDLRRSRSAVENIIPTTTGSISAVGKILPELEGKIDGLAFRIPTPTVSISDVRLVLKKKTEKEELNNFLRSAVKNHHLKKILGVSDGELVSMDFRTDSRSGIIDAPLTKVVSEKYVQIQIWYDNEWGYAARLIDVLEKLSKG
jgi:glyceraldehyde 3-phosphate dehydrogenase